MQPSLAFCHLFLATFQSNPRGRTTMKWNLVVVACLLVPTLARAQVYYSTLVGTVRDPSGAIVANAAITATEVATGVVTSATSNDSGDYRIATLRPGVYSISATRANFKT